MLRPDSLERCFGWKEGDLAAHCSLTVRFDLLVF